MTVADETDESTAPESDVEIRTVFEAGEQYNDARLLTPFDIRAYKDQPFKWTIGPNKESKNWRHDEKTPDVATLVLRLSQHREDKNKDGLAFVTGDMAPGQRLKTAVKALYAIGLHYDKGTPAKQIDDALVKLGCLAIRYTTHSNGKQREQFKRDEIVKWLRDTGQDEDTEIDTDLMRQYLSVKKGWDPSVVRTVKFMGIEHENKGIMVSISHAPMSKNRVVIPLAEPFVIADVASTQQEAITKWAKVAPAMSQLLGLGDALDMTGTDTSRLFYFPRHARNMPWEITISGGDLFDWKMLELDGAPQVKAVGQAPAKTKKTDNVGQNDQKPAHITAIDNLTSESSDEELNDVTMIVAKAGLPIQGRDRAKERIKERTGIKLLTVEKMLKYAEQRLEREAKGDEHHGLDLFTYSGEFNFDDAVKKCIRALKQANEKSGLPIFSHVSGDLVRLNQTDKDGRLSFDELSAQALWSELNNRVAFVRKSNQAESARQMVPKEVAAQVWEQGYLELPPAPEILYTPVYTREGNLMVSPGYWPDHDLLMADTGFRVRDIPEEPTAEQVEEAVNWLRTEIFGDFPFLDYDLDDNERREPSEANAFAMLLTPFMRRMISSCTPAFFVTKPTPGTGGTLLAMVPLILFDGIEPTPLRYTASEEEMQKLITAAIMETRSSMFFDDVGEFNNRVLLMSLTAKNIGGRVLGYSRNVTRPNNFLWQGTGNNPDVKSEMERRICWVRMNAKTHDIQKRKFRHPNFVQFLLENRETAVRHILTMIEYWHAIGAPRFTERKRASFEDWSEKVGGVLMACGIEGFLDNKATPTQNMDEANIKDFVKNWLLHYKVRRRVTVRELFAWAGDTDIVSGNNDDQKKSRFYKLVPSLDGRVFEIEGVDYIIRSGRDNDDNAAFYIEQVKHDAPVDTEASA
jgi:hypothetical protein